MKKACIVSDSIVSPLGLSTESVFQAMQRGDSSLSLHDSPYSDVEPLMGSLFSSLDRDTIEERVVEVEHEALSFFEKMLIAAAADALAQTNINGASADTIWIISTTKGNIAELEKLNKKNSEENSLLFLWKSAQRVASYFGNHNQPIVISNACISGISAQITAVRLLQQGLYNNAVIVGGDLVSRFVVAGFQSFKALSASECRPFDLERNGLNLGECAAAMVVSLLDDEESCQGFVSYEAFGTSNDANHISGPSRTAEGLYRAIRKSMLNSQLNELAFINAHGTATPYNDEMESIAIERSGLTDYWVNSFKGYVGHTLGAAGVIETILAVKSLQQGILLPTKGFATLGVSAPLQVVKEIKKTEGTQCLKMASGFGGCNGVIRLKYWKK